MRTFAKTPQKSEKNQDFAAFLRVSNFYHFAARASPTSSLAPLESLVQALSNGARLEVGGARGADLWLFENTRKHAKWRTGQSKNCRCVDRQTMNTRFSNKESKNIVTVEYQIPQNRQKTLKKKLDFYANLSGLPMGDVSN